LLDSNVRQISARLENRRKTVEIIESSQAVPINTPDQVIVHGKMDNESVFLVHYRGGLSRGTNFCCEINGTRGDLVITCSSGYPAIGDVRIQGAQDREPRVHDLPIPSKYLHHSAPEGPPQAVFYNYLRIAQDIQTGSRLTPTFEDAVILHQIIDSVQASAKNGSRTTIHAAQG